MPPKTSSEMIRALFHGNVLPPEFMGICDVLVLVKECDFGTYYKEKHASYYCEQS